MCAARARLCGQRHLPRRAVTAVSSSTWHTTSLCLQHSGTWLEAPTHNADGSAATVDRQAFPEGGLWLCCGSKLRSGGRGCAIGEHTNAAPPAPVPEERRISPDIVGAPASGPAEAAATEATATAAAVTVARLPSFIESNIPTRVEYERWRVNMRR